MPSIRPAALNDLPALAALHLAAWEATYRGLMPAAILDAQRAEPRIESWSRFLSGKRPPGAGLWVAVIPGTSGTDRRPESARAGDSDVPLGFVRTGAARAPEAQPGAAEIQALYLAPDQIGRGLGRALMQHALNELRAAGYARVEVEVLVGNERALRFYAAAGFEPFGGVHQRKLPGHAPTLPHRRYARVL